MDSHPVLKILFLLSLWTTSLKCDLTDFDEIAASSSVSKSDDDSSSSSDTSSSSDAGLPNLSVDEQLLESLEQKLVEQVIGNQMSKNEVLPVVPIAKFEQSDASTETSSKPSDSTDAIVVDAEPREIEQQDKDPTTDDLSIESSEEVRSKTASEVTSSARSKETPSLFDHPRLQMPYQVSVDFDEGPLYPSRQMTQGLFNMKTEGKEQGGPSPSSYLSPSGLPKDNHALYYDDADLSSMSEEDSSQAEGTRRPNLPLYYMGVDRPGYTTTSTLSMPEHHTNPSTMLPPTHHLYGSPNGGSATNLYNDGSRFRLTQAGYELFHPQQLHINGHPTSVENDQMLPAYVPYSNHKPHYGGYMPRPHLPLYHHYPNRPHMGNFAYESDGGVYGYVPELHSHQQHHQDPNTLFRAFGQDLNKLVHRKNEEEKSSKEKEVWDKIVPPYDEAEVENSNKTKKEQDSPQEDKGTVAPYENFIGFRKIQNPVFHPDTWWMYGNEDNRVRMPETPAGYLRSDGMMESPMHKLRKNYWRPYEQERYIDFFDDNSNELHSYGGPVVSRNNEDLASWLRRLYSNNAPSPQFYGNRGARLSDVDDTNSGIPACALQNSTFCFEDEDYPRNEILYALDKEGFMLQRLLAPRNPKNGKTADLMDASEVEGRVCDAETIEGQPMRAINTLGQWKVILNFKDVETYKPFSQRVRIEKCMKPGQPCSFTKQEVETHCVQKFAFEHLISWNLRKGFHMDVFELPIACTCQIKKISTTTEQ